MRSNVSTRSTRSTHSTDTQPADTQPDDTQSADTDGRVEHQWYEEELQESWEPQTRGEICEAKKKRGKDGWVDCTTPYKYIIDSSGFQIRVCGTHYGVSKYALNLNLSQFPIDAAQYF